jgi:Zn-finger nucleic acid-binding protein
MPSSLNCPTCGAPAPSPDAVRCEYCRSILTTVACPSCFGAMFAGMDYCPHCGAKGSRAIDEYGATLPCPGCRADMRPMQVGATAMYECSSCASLWLDAARFTQLCTDREERGAVALFVGVTKAKTDKLTLAPVRYVSCPICNKTMNRQNFGRRSGVIIDVCKGHGVWFEHHELRSVLAFIDGGGFEQARKLDDQRQAEEQAALRKAYDAAGREFAQLDIAGMRPFRRPGSDADGLLGEALRKLFS